MEQRHVLMDVDTGVDDALAIMLALHAEGLNIVGITTVSGNTSSTQAARNTEFIMEQLRMGGAFPVAVGARMSLAGRTPTTLADIHGADGLGGAFDNASRSRGKPRRDESAIPTAVEMMLGMARDYGPQLSIVATAPLTNLAEAIMREPLKMAEVGQIVMMGGALDTGGNITEHAEFNAYFDPKALSVVLGSGIPTILFPLDVTETVRILESSLTPSLGIASGQLALIAAITKTYVDFHDRRYGFRGFFVHDALPVMYLLEPSIFHLRSGPVTVDCSTSDTSGQTSWADNRGENGRLQVAVSVCEADFLARFWEYLRRPLVRRFGEAG